MSAYENLKLSGLELPIASEDSKTIAMVKRFGDRFLYISGMGPVWNGNQTYSGRVPSAVSVEYAQEAAKRCALNILASLEKEIGDLNLVKTIVKLLVFVASDQDFNQQHIVANGASNVFISVFGEEFGKAARSAIGVAELPLGFPVEVEALVELKE